MNIETGLVDLQNNTTTINAEKNKETMGNSELGQDAFLQLLMTQLKYQDPLNPMGNQEFIAQQAQFTQISELQKLNSNVAQSNQMMQASSIIGMEASVMDPEDASNTITGIVSEAKINGTETNIVVDGVEYPISSITSVKEPATGSN